MRAFARIVFVRIAVIVALSFAGAAPVRAEDDPAKTTDTDRANLQSCIEAVHDGAGSAEQCIGAASNPCMENPSNQNTNGMVACAMREEGFWDAQLNFVYQELRTQLAEPARTELRDIQRVWITWRNATCAFPISLYGGGTAFRPATALCSMKETARRAIDLGQILDEVSMR